MTGGIMAAGGGFCKGGTEDRKRKTEGGRQGAETNYCHRGIADGDIRDLRRQAVSDGRAGARIPLAREVADIFIPLARNENSAMTVIDSLRERLAGVDRSGRGFNPRPARNPIFAGKGAGIFFYFFFARGCIFRFFVA